MRTGEKLQCRCAHAPARSTPCGLGGKLRQRVPPAPTTGGLAGAPAPGAGNQAHMARPALFVLAGRRGYLRRFLSPRNQQNPKRSLGKMKAAEGPGRPRSSATAPNPLRNPSELRGLQSAFEAARPATRREIPHLGGDPSGGAGPGTRGPAGPPGPAPPPTPRGARSVRGAAMLPAQAPRSILGTL
uniref:collagen alpha-1(II) chain-like n=1 Tax=Jaculus jaculus TaxID=51337 RepID=UPI00064D6703|nr:collagen alpha-1(II) chain-like [Jaculus jaculus]